MNTEFQDTAMNIDDQAWNGDWCLANSDPKAEFQAGAEPTPARRKRAPVACRRYRSSPRYIFENSAKSCPLDADDCEASVCTKTLIRHASFAELLVRQQLQLGEFHLYMKISFIYKQFVACLLVEGGVIASSSYREMTVK